MLGSTLLSSYRDYTRNPSNEYSFRSESGIPPNFPMETPQVPRLSSRSITKQGTGTPSRFKRRYIIYQYYHHGRLHYKNHPETGGGPPPVGAIALGYNNSSREDKIDINLIKMLGGQKGMGGMGSPIGEQREYSSPIQIKSIRARSSTQNQHHKQWGHPSQSGPSTTRTSGVLGSSLQRAGGKSSSRWGAAGSERPHRPSGGEWNIVSRQKQQFCLHSHAVERAQVPRGGDKDNKDNVGKGEGGRKKVAGGNMNMSPPDINSEEFTPMYVDYALSEGSEEGNTEEIGTPNRTQKNKRGIHAEMVPKAPRSPEVQEIGKRRFRQGTQRVWRKGQRKGPKLEAKGTTLSLNSPELREHLNVLDGAQTMQGIRNTRKGIGSLSPSHSPQSPKESKFCIRCIRKESTFENSTEPLLMNPDYHFDYVGGGSYANYKNFGGKGVSGKYKSSTAHGGRRMGKSKGNMGNTTTTTKQSVSIQIERPRTGILSVSKQEMGSLGSICSTGNAGNIGSPRSPMSGKSLKSVKSEEGGVREELLTQGVESQIPLTLEGMETQDGGLELKVVDAGVGVGGDINTIGTPYYSEEGARYPYKAYLQGQYKTKYKEIPSRMLLVHPRPTSMKEERRNKGNMGMGTQNPDTNTQPISISNTTYDRKSVTQYRGSGVIGSSTGFGGGRVAWARESAMLGRVCVENVKHITPGQINAQFARKKQDKYLSEKENRLKRALLSEVYNPNLHRHHLFYSRVSTSQSSEKPRIPQGNAVPSVHEYEDVDFKIALKKGEVDFSNVIPLEDIAPNRDMGFSANLASGVFPMAPQPMPKWTKANIPHKTPPVKHKSISNNAKASLEKVPGVIIGNLRGTPQFSTNIYGVSGKVTHAQKQLLREIIQQKWENLSPQFECKIGFHEEKRQYNIIIYGSGCLITRCCESGVLLQVNSNKTCQVICMNKSCIYNPIEIFLIPQMQTSFLFQTPQNYTTQQELRIMRSSIHHDVSTGTHRQISLRDCEEKHRRASTAKADIKGGSKLGEKVNMREENKNKNSSVVNKPEMFNIFSPTPPEQIEGRKTANSTNSKVLGPGKETDDSDLTLFFERTKRKPFRLKQFPFNNKDLRDVIAQHSRTHSPKNTIFPSNFSSSNQLTNQL